jgi:hypothetical protein
VARGREVRGEFRNSKRTGQGTFTWPNGADASRIRDSKRTRQNFTWPSSAKYVRSLDGMQDGQG